MASHHSFTHRLSSSRFSSSAAPLFIIIGFAGFVAFHYRQSEFATTTGIVSASTLSAAQQDYNLGTTNPGEPEESEITTRKALRKQVAKAPSIGDIVNYFEWNNWGACKVYFEFGGKVMKGNAVPGIDGQKAVCMDPGLMPEPGNCTIYSMGVGYNWSFDDVMDDYGCDIYAFDPTVSNPFQNRSSTSRIRFYDSAFGVRDVEMTRQGWRVESLKTIRKNLGHEDRVIDYLKMDIEGGEWDLLRALIGSEEMKSVKQLSIEIHLSGRDVKKLRQDMRILQELEDSGFVRFFARENVWNRIVLPGGVKGAACYEIAWFNKQFMKHAS